MYHTSFTLTIDALGKARERDYLARFVLRLLRIEGKIPDCTRQEVLRANSTFFHACEASNGVYEYKGNHLHHGQIRRIASLISASRGGHRVNKKIVEQSPRWIAIDSITPFYSKAEDGAIKLGKVVIEGYSKHRAPHAIAEGYSKWALKSNVTFEYSSRDNNFGGILFLQEGKRNEDLCWQESYDNYVLKAEGASEFLEMVEANKDDDWTTDAFVRHLRKDKVLLGQDPSAIREVTKYIAEKRAEE